MRDELPPQEVFNLLSNLYELIGQFGIKLPTDYIEYDLALVALASKAITHTREALQIFGERAAIGEAIILLRSAYEATVVFLYLKLNSQQFFQYKAYAEIVELRNQMETLELTYDELDETSRNEQLEKNQAHRNKILIDNFHLFYTLSESDLHDLTKLKKVANKAHFIPFEDMKISLLKDPFTSALVKTGFQVYNLGSQMAHSHYNMTICTYIQDQAHPIYDTYAIAREIAYLLFFNSYGLDQLGRMKPGFATAFQPIFMQTLDKIRQASGDPTPLY